MSSVQEPDYFEVFEDLKHLEEKGEWKDGIPHWTFAFSRQLGVQVGHPAVLYEAWKHVAERAMDDLQTMRSQR
jgi:hypothetical protein